MRKEVYRVRRPTHIKFGDPWYYKQYQGDELKRLIVDCQPPPELNDARIVLREQSNQISPEYIEYIMTIYYASSAYIHTYTSDMVYPSQKSKDKPISVDTARYVLEVDGRQQVIHTGGDGWWGGYSELYRETEKGRILDAVIIEVVMPDEWDFNTMRVLAGTLFEDMQPVSERKPPRRDAVER